MGQDTGLKYAVLNAIEQAVYFDTAWIGRTEFEWDGKPNARIRRLHPLAGGVCRLEHFFGAPVDTRKPRDPVGFIRHEAPSFNPPL